MRLSYVFINEAADTLWNHIVVAFFFRQFSAFCAYEKILFSHLTTEQVLHAFRLGFKELSARLETIETTLRSTLLDTMAEVRATSREVKAISANRQPIHHPDLCDEPLRDCGDAVPCTNSHSDTFHAGEPQNDHPDKTEPAPPTSQDFLRRLKRGYLLQYERDDDERDETRNNVHTASLTDRVKQEARF